MPEHPGPTHTRERTVSHGGGKSADQQPTFRWELSGIGGILALAALLGAWELRRLTYGSDVGGYLEPLHVFLATGSYPGAHFPPGVGLMAYPFFLAVGNIPLSGMLAAYACYLGCVAMGWLVGRRVAGAGAGLWAALFVALTPYLLESAGVGMSEAPFTLWLLLAWWLFLRLLYRDRGWAAHAALGACLGMLYLVRPEGMGIALLALASLSARGWLRSGRRHGTTGRAVLVDLLAAWLVFALMAGPYVIFLKHQTGAWTISGKTKEVFFVYGTMVTWDKHLGEDFSDLGDRSIAGYIRKHPDIFALRVGRNLFTMARRTPSAILHALAPLTLVLLVYPFLGRRRSFDLGRPRPGPWWLAWSVAVFISPLAPLLAFNVSDRYLLPSAVVLAVAAAAVLSRLLAGCGGRARRFLVTACLLLVGLIASGAGQPPPGPVTKLFPTYKSVRDVLHTPHGSAGFTSAGRWLRAHGRHTAGRLKILGPAKAHLALIFAGDLSRPADRSGTTHTYVCGLGLDRIAAFLNQGRYDYLVLDFHHTLQPHCPALSRLWRDPTIAREHGFRLVHRDPQGLFMIFGPRTDG